MMMPPLDLLGLVGGSFSDGMIDGNARNDNVEPERACKSKKGFERTFFAVLDAGECVNTYAGGLCELFWFPVFTLSPVADVRANFFKKEFPRAFRPVVMVGNACGSYQEIMGCSSVGSLRSYIGRRQFLFPPIRKNESAVFHHTTSCVHVNKKRAIAYCCDGSGPEGRYVGFGIRSSVGQMPILRSSSKVVLAP